MSHFTESSATTDVDVNSVPVINDAFSLLNATPLQGNCAVCYTCLQEQHSFIDDGLNVGSSILHQSSSSWPVCNCRQNIALSERGRSEVSRTVCSTSTTSAAIVNASRPCTSRRSSFALQEKRSAGPASPPGAPERKKLTMASKLITDVHKLPQTLHSFDETCKPVSCSSPIDRQFPISAFNENRCNLLNANNGDEVAETPPNDVEEGCVDEEECTVAVDDDTEATACNINGEISVLNPIETAEMSIIDLTYSDDDVGDDEEDDSSTTIFTSAVSSEVVSNTANPYVGSVVTNHDRVDVSLLTATNVVDLNGQTLDAIEIAQNASLQEPGIRNHLGDPLRGHSNRSQTIIAHPSVSAIGPNVSAPYLNPIAQPSSQLPAFNCQLHAPIHMQPNPPVCPYHTHFHGVLQQTCCACCQVAAATAAAVAHSSVIPAMYMPASIATAAPPCLIHRTPPLTSISTGVAATDLPVTSQACSVLHGYSYPHLCYHTVYNQPAFGYIPHNSSSFMSQHQYFYPQPQPFTMALQSSLMTAAAAAPITAVTAAAAPASISRSQIAAFPPARYTHRNVPYLTPLPLNRLNGSVSNNQSQHSSTLPPNQQRLLQQQHDQLARQRDAHALWFQQRQQQNSVAAAREPALYFDYLNSVNPWLPGSGFYPATAATATPLAALAPNEIHYQRDDFASTAVAAAAAAAAAVAPLVNANETAASLTASVPLRRSSSATPFAASNTFLTPGFGQYMVLQDALHGLLLQHLPTDAPQGASRTCIDKYTIKHRYEKPKDITEEEKCSVCLCEYEKDEEVRCLACMHFFHVQCIDRWLLSNKKCPICRVEIDRRPPPSASQAAVRNRFSVYF